MRVSRRSLLAGAGAAAAFVSAPLAAAAGTGPAFVAACRTAAGGWAAAVMDADGIVLFTAPLDARGHDAAAAPDGRRAVVFARRPGRFAVVLDFAAGRAVQAVAPPPSRHFNGHGLFSRDGRLLFATENDVDGGHGVLGIYDAGDRFRRLGEFPTHGIGPHEALLMADGRTIAVANGGILTHPELPRQKLNLATMAPSLALIDSASGDLLALDTLPAHLHRLSIRHLAEASGGVLWFGGQYEGPRSDRVALVGTFGRDSGLALVAAPDSLYGAMRQYVGSVGATRDGATIVTTSPVGGVAVAWDVATRRVAAVRRHADVCGVAASCAGYVLSTGHGRLITADGVVRTNAVAWDNHLRSVAGACADAVD